jgi:hypothetical protein
VLPISFVLYDMNGKKVTQLILNEQNNNINMSLLASGMYIWKTTNQGHLSNAGKIIIHK